MGEGTWGIGGGLAAGKAQLFSASARTRVVAVLVLLLFLVAANSASAQQTHRPVSPFEFPDAGIERVCSVGVDQANGDVYVLQANETGTNQGNGKEFEGALYRFDSSGAPAPFSAGAAYISGNELTGTPNGPLHNCFGTAQVVVAPPGALGGTAGDIYIATGSTVEGAGVVDIFASSGKYLGRIDAAAGEPFTIANGAGAAGVAVDGVGNIYLSEQRNGKVDKYVPGANPPSNADYDSRISTGITVQCGLELAASSSTLYAANCGGSEGAHSFPLSLFPGGGGEFDASGSTTVIEAEGAPVRAEAIAVDPGNGDLYVDENKRITQLDAGGTLISRFGAPTLTRSPGIALDSSGGLGKARRVYALNAPEGSEGVSVPGKVAVWGPQIALADVVTGSASLITGASVTLNGTVNPDGQTLTDCKFEYGSGTSYGQTIPCNLSPAEIGIGHSPIAVKADLAGLNGGSALHYRLVATNECEAGEQCPSGGEDESVATLGPQIHATGATHITDTCVALEGLIDPAGQSTNYAFEYVSEANFLSSEWAAATAVPIPPAPIGAGPSDVAVAQQVCGLVPRTTYHLRLVASSADGTNIGPGQVFTTFSTPTGGLPDGRAYEQASPVEKNGNGIQFEPNAVQAAANGSAITFYANGGLPGGEGAQNFPSYLAKRGQTSSDWVTQGLLPPAATGSLGAVARWDDELQTVYTTNKKPDGGPTLYVRDTKGGALGTVTVSTGKDEITVAAESGDGEFLLIESASELMAVSEGSPAAGAANLYLWERASGRLVVAGVLNDGHAPDQGAFAGPYDWFRDTGSFKVGGAARHYYVQSQHAISTDGSAVFFTAGSGVLYERLNPSKAQSALDGDGNCTEPTKACTVQVSVSLKTNGEGLNGTDPLGPQPAAFMGASDSGSASYFTSAEELTNDANTGPESGISRSNLEGGEAENGLVPAFASALALDAGHVYWANRAAGTIGRANLDGTEVEPAFITGARHPEGIAVDASHVYWTNPGNGADGEGSIGRAELDGSDATQDFITGASNPSGVAVNGSNVFWSNRGSSAATRKIARATLAGASIKQLIPVTGTSGAAGLTIQGSFIYWTNPAEEVIGRANVSGAEANQEIIPHSEEEGKKVLVSKPAGIAADASHLYWANTGSESLGRAALSGASIEQGFVSGVAKPEAIGVDATHLFWSSSGGDQGNDLYRYDAASHTLTDLTPAPTPANGAEVKGVLAISKTGSYVYFVAAAALTSGAPASSCTRDGESVEGLCNLYMWHDGETAFITQLKATKGSIVNDRTDYRDWVPALHTTTATLENTSRVSADGSTLLFRSQAKLTAYDNHGFSELYRSVSGGAPECITCDPTGAPPTGSAAMQVLTEPTFGPKLLNGGVQVLTRNLSADGRRVFFDSPDQLVATDQNEVNDVYEWEANGKGSCQSEAENGGCLYLISSGTSPRPSYFGDASTSGDDVFFATAQPLVGQDQDELIDVYDARVGGESQNPPPPSTCTDEASCLGPLGSPPTATAPAPPVREGNPSNPLRCKKGYKKVKRNGKVVCIKVKHHSKHHQKRKAHTNKGSRR